MHPTDTFSRPKPKILFTELEAAEYLHLSVRTLQGWRVKGSPLTFIKVGRAVRYRLTDLEAFVERGSRRSTSEWTGGNDGEQPR